MKPDSDLSVVHRAGRIAAVQASLALAAVLLVVGAVVYFVDIRVQEQQIRSQLSSVALAADDATDPPPGMILVLRDLAGKVEVSADGIPTAELLARPAGFSEAQIDGVPYRAVVVDRPEGRVVALLDLEPYKAGRSRLLLSLGIAELAGIVASIAVVASAHQKVDPPTCRGTGPATTFRGRRIARTSRPADGAAYPYPATRPPLR